MSVYVLFLASVIAVERRNLRSLYLYWVCPARAEAEQTKYLLVAAAYTATELMMKEFVSADEPIRYALALLAHYFLIFCCSAALNVCNSMQ